MKTIIALGAVVAIVSLTGCATSSPQAGNAAYTAPRTFQYDNANNGTATVPAGINVDNPGTMFNPNNTSEENDL
jgi:outer membrane lipoprotein SlyB